MTPAEVEARRTGTAQVFVLGVPGEEAQWCVRQWGFKPRRGRLAPWWYTPGLTWHLYAGVSPGDGPPVASFATIGEAKLNVQHRLTPGGGAR